MAISEGIAETGLAAAGTQESLVATIDFGDVALTPERYGKLASYLSEQVLQSEQETRPYRESVMLWRQFVDPPDKPKSFPWPGASSVRVPIPRIVIDSLKGSIKQTIKKQPKMWVADIDPDALGIEPDQQFDVQKDMEQFAEHVSKEDGFLELEKLLDDVTEELLVTGIGPIKISSESDTRTVVTSSREEQEVTLRSGPQLWVVPVDNFIWPAGLWKSLDDMPWCGDRTEHTPESLRLRADAPWNYKFVEETINLGAGVTPDAQTQQKREIVGQLPMTPKTLMTYDVAILWDMHGDGKYHDVIVTFNPWARRIHRIVYNPIADAKKNYEVEVGSTRTGTIFGRGIIEPIVQPCRAINTAINQTFDSQTLANAPSIVHPEESEAAAILADGFYPGIPLPYKESKDEIGVLKLPDPSASSFQLVQFFMTIVERLTRVGPQRLGDVSQGKRTPASLGLATQQIGAELIDELIDRIRITLGRLVKRAIMLYEQTSPDIFMKVLGEERGNRLRDIVKFSRESRNSARETLRLRLMASSASRSQDLERQNALATAQFLFGWYRQSIELVGLFMAPETPLPAKEILVDVIKSAQEQMRRVVALADQPDPETLVPQMAEKLEEMLKAQAAGPQMQTGGIPGGNGGVDLASLLGGGQGGGPPLG